MSLQYYICVVLRFDWLCGQEPVAPYSSEPCLRWAGRKIPKANTVAKAALLLSSSFGSCDSTGLRDREMFIFPSVYVLSTTCGGEPFGADGSNHLLLLACGAVYKEAGLFRLTEVTGHDPWNCQSRTACTIGPLQLSVTGSQLFCSIVCS